MISLLVLNLQGTVFQGEVEKIIAPGRHGQFTILPHHLPFFTTLKKGAILYEISSQQTAIEVPDKGGIFELAHKQVTILLSN